MKVVSQPRLLHSRRSSNHARFRVFHKHVYVFGNHALSVCAGQATTLTTTATTRPTTTLPPSAREGSTSGLATNELGWGGDTVD